MYLKEVKVEVRIEAKVRYLLDIHLNAFTVYSLFF